MPRTLAARRPGAAVPDEPSLPDLGRWASARQLLRPAGWPALGPALLAHLGRARWFGGKARSLRSVTIVEAIPVAGQARAARGVLAMVRVEYARGETEIYSLPLAVVAGARAGELRARASGAVLARLQLSGRGHATEALLVDGIADSDFCRELLVLFRQRRRRAGLVGALHAGAVGAGTRGSVAAERGPLTPRLLGVEQSNSSVVYGERLILKLLRRLDEGPSPELELGQLLTRRGFRHVPPLGGWLEYRTGSGAAMTVALLQPYVPNQGDGWSFTLQQLRRFFERALGARSPVPALPCGAPLGLLGHAPTAAVERRIGAYLQSARLLGQRTAELHQVLASEPGEPALAPEPPTPSRHRLLVRSCKALCAQVWRALRRRLPGLPQDLRPLATELLVAEQRVVARFEALLRTPITVPRIRCHGDFHLGQVLCTGQDFVIIDFEGEPARPIGDRRRKRFALTDVAGMLRSFHYAACIGLAELVDRTRVSGPALASMQRHAALWQVWSSWAFLTGYLAPARACGLAPVDGAELETLLGALVLEKAIYELGYELEHRPGWVGIPLAGILQALEA